MHKSGFEAQKPCRGISDKETRRRRLALAADAYGFSIVTNWQCMTCSHRMRLRSEQQVESNIGLILAVEPGPNKLIPPQRCPLSTHVASAAPPATF